MDIRKTLFLVSTLALFSFGVFAQSARSLSGLVKDPADAAISGVAVSLLNAQQVVLQVAVTDADGRFSYENIPPGTYVIRADRSGFSTQTKSVKIDSLSTNIDLILEISSPTANVTVTAEANTAEDRINIPAEINIINEDTISKRTTAVLAQVANEEQGVSLQRTSPTIGSVLVRGLTEVGVYVDGVRYTNSTQRGGINTFFNLNEPTAIRSVEIQRSPNTAQFGSDGLGGNVQLISRQPVFGMGKPAWNGEYNSSFNTSDRSFGGNLLASYGLKRFGILGNIVARRINDLRPGEGIDGHSAVTRFLGLPSDTIGSTRLPDTSFTQYGGTLQLSFSPSDDQHFSARYQRSQQDGGKRYDQLLGGDGNLIADLRNLMLDFGYLRYYKQQLGFFDNFSGTFSFNSQREERINQGGQGNPLAAITNDKERTTTWGGSFFLDKQFARNNFLFGGDIYRDIVSASSFTTEPSLYGQVTITRPRVPNGAKYDLFGLFVQHAFEAIPNRLRVSGALRYNVGVYRSRAGEAPTVNGQPLFPDDSGRFADFSGRIGAVFTFVKGLNAAFNYSRGFRAPNTTSLGSLGLVGVGFQVSASSIAHLGATIGTTADATAISTGIAVSPLRSEISSNYEGSLRFRNMRFESSITGFLTNYEDMIVRQALILPPGAVGTQLGSQTITSQNANGAVFVPLSTSPVLVQSNLNSSRLYGAEITAEFKITSEWKVGGNFSYLYAEDRATKLPPNLGGGGMPPAMGFFHFR
ncbi:MAG: TonB-dependent receptor, partial [Pyrinomonadaceae bacterium]